MKEIHNLKMINFVYILMLVGLIFVLYLYICQTKTKSMSKSPLFISGEILKRAKEQGLSISNMSLQKLLFIANGAYLAKTGNPLIDEPIEVWQFGPVVKSVYHEFKNYGSTDIKHIPSSNRLGEDKNLDATAEEALEFVLEVASKLDAIQLSNWTHLPDSPWSNAKEAGQNIISNEVMQGYFKQFIKKKED
ncbi:Panacea domain-containing protein [Flavobacterium sp. N1736]|uniref:Panacea domain-containing protein n=1 Tax=Flavobacterium sp. N1736 TaxID=2986823 RepID=UPI0022242086|nr:type II toxin-antitoxin system antitoxin SocA domain-containing protein [Flavobacterium sp. N1736]